MEDIELVKLKVLTQIILTLNVNNIFLLLLTTLFAVPINSLQQTRCRSFDYYVLFIFFI